MDVLGAKVLINYHMTKCATIKFAYVRVTARMYALFEFHYGDACATELHMFVVECFHAGYST